MKTCKKCLLEKEEIEFAKCAKNENGIRNECKICHNKYMADYKLKNKDELTARRKGWERENAGRIHIRNQEYHKQHKEKHNTYQLEYYQLNKDRQKQRDRLRSKERKEYNYEYCKERLNSDLLFRFKHNLRSLIRNALKRRNYSKNSKTQQLLGVNYELAKNWLEYTWFLNYGAEYSGEKVEIDHVIPCSRAITEEEATILQHISNLQYLTPEDNISKQNKYEV